MNKQIGIIIPIHNGINYTKTSLKQLYESIETSNLKIRIKIIIIDDGSTDGSSQWIKANYYNIKVLEGNGNLWWSGSINLGVKYALTKLNCEYIILWNNDISPSLNYFKNLEIIIKESPIDTIISSKVYFMNNPNMICTMGFLFNLKTGKKTSIGSHQIDNEKYNRTFEINCTGGQGVLIPKIVFEKIGYFDEINFPQYHGDTDFTLRANKNGFKIIAYPTLKIWNDISNTGMQKNNLKTLIQSLYSIKSNNNIFKDIKFHRHHPTSLLAYFYIFLKYYYYIGGYFKHKIQNKKTILNNIK